MLAEQLTHMKVQGESNKQLDGSCPQYLTTPCFGSIIQLAFFAFTFVYILKFEYYRVTKQAPHAIVA
jgi:hypothetical protein